MKYKLITALLLFSTYNFADSINTGHANVSLIKYSANNSEANEFFIGVKMDMQKIGIPIGKTQGTLVVPLKYPGIYPMAFQ